MAKKAPIYQYNADYAREHDELPKYRASRQANIACKDAIDKAISRHYINGFLKKEAVQEVVDQFGYERTLYVLANTIRHRDWDERFSTKNHRWAAAFSIKDTFDRSFDYVANSHSILLDDFTDMAREGYQLAQQQGQTPQMSMM